MPISQIAGDSEEEEEENHEGGINEGKIQVG